MPDSKTKRPCKHCGSPIPDAIDDDFCCTGCAYVYRMIKEAGLNQYYALRDKMIDPIGTRVFRESDFEPLKRWQETAETQSESDVVEGSLSLQGISCVGCVWLVERVYQKHGGAIDIRIDAHTGRVQLRWQRGTFSIVNFARETAQFGYILGLTVQGKQSATKGLVTRLGLCAAFMMNAMLFAFPRYLGMEKDFLLANLFEMLSILFASLSLLVGGSYFIQRAWRSMRMRVLHIDIPIALGLVLAFIGSIAGWFLEYEGLLYFDFISVFVFLMLGGRWVQEWFVERSRNQWIDTNAFPETIEVLDAETNAWTERGLSELETGMSIRVRPGSVVPVSSELESDSCEMGLEWINGESEPIVYEKHARVPAGAANLSDQAIELKADEPWAESLVKRLTQTRKGAVSRDPHMDDVLRTYLLSIIGIAVVAGLAWAFFGTWVQGLQVAISILVISCPCSIGVAWPLAVDRSVQALRKRGVFVREPLIWHALKEIRTIIFDKTGTLTLERPELKNPDGLTALDSENQSILAGLVRHNLHPVSRSLRESLIGLEATASEIQKLEDLPGVGIKGVFENAPVFLGRSKAHPGKTVFERDGAVVALFEFTDSIRLDARDALAVLGKRGLGLEILSGDNPEKVAALEKAINSSEISNAQGGMSPEGKARRIQEIGPKHTMMIGDGVNDALAFETANLQGTPLVDRSLLVDRAAFYFSGQSLRGICDLFQVADALRASGRTMFGIALTYNALALIVCFMGIMSPLVAAFAMPISSIVTVVFTLSTLKKHLAKLG